MLKNRVFAGIGSNMGWCIENCSEAIIRLSNMEKIDVCNVSSFYKTAPVGLTNQNWFVNCVVELRTSYSIDSLFQKFLLIENSMGRIRKRRWGERIIDIDLLLFNELILENRSLIVPHPRMHERGFVLMPMAEIAPGQKHPVLKKSIRDLLSSVSDQKVFLIGK